MSNRKKFFLKLIIVIVLIAIIIYTFKGSLGDIVAEIADTKPYIVAAICASSVIYHVFEAWITFSLARRYNPRFKFREAMYCAFYCSFYRLSTLGSGAGVAAVVYLGHKGVGYFEATGLYMIQYVVHKVGIAIFSGIFFLINWKTMYAYFKDYAFYLIAAYVITVLIAIALVLFAVSKKFHTLIIYLGKKLNRSGKLDEGLKSLEKNCAIMEKSAKELLTNAKIVISMWLKTTVKLMFWYIIPFIVLGSSGVISPVDSWSVTSLAIMSAAVIPTPAGIASSELVMTALYSRIVEVYQAAAVTVLYRFATFIFPFIFGGVLILIAKIVRAARR